MPRLSRVTSRRRPLLPLLMPSSAVASAQPVDPAAESDDKGKSRINNKNCGTLPGSKQLDEREKNKKKTNGKLRDDDVIPQMPTVMTLTVLRLWL